MAQRECPSTQNPAAARFRRRGIALLAIFVPLMIWLRLVTPLGDISNHYTDHLRHMGEALAILETGWSPYRLPYAQATAHTRLPCPAHGDLWGDQVSLYPPLGLLIHAPVAILERDGALSPESAHKLMGLFWLLVGIAAILSSFALLPEQPIGARVGFAAVAAPLLVGTGANAFFDVGFVLLSALALLAFRRNRWSLATVLFAFAGAMHFRAVVLLPFAVTATIRAARSQPRVFVLVAVLCSALLIPSAYAALLVVGFASSIAAHNPAHYGHHGVSFWLTCSMCLVAAGSTLRFSKAAAISFVMCGALIIVDPMHAWWHALLIVLPVMSLAADVDPKHADNRLWTLGWVWSCAMGFIVFRHPLGPFWQWALFALHGVS